MKVNLKESKAITLMALIITIIILLILAVVTINAVNEGNLFAHSNNAVAKYQESAKKENNKISELISKIPGESEIPSVLRKYVLGENEEGITLWVELDENEGILDSWGNFKDNSTINNASTTLHLVKISDEAFFKYDVNGKYYAIIVDENSKTIDLIEVYEPSGSNNIGKTLTYKGKSYTVISDNGTDLELVANYVSEDKLTIGADTYEEALAAYNNAITMLNNAAIDATGLTIGGDVKDIRSIGTSGHIDDVGYFENPDSTTYSRYEGNARDKDEFYVLDVMKLYEANTLDIDSKNYWLASRCNFINSNRIVFGIYHINNPYINLTGCQICEVFSSGNTYGTSEHTTNSYSVRPVVTLSANASGITWND